jgi:hypothetical protein
MLSWDANTESFKCHFCDKTKSNVELMELLYLGEDFPSSLAMERAASQTSVCSHENINFKTTSTMEPSNLHFQQGHIGQPGHIGAARSWTTL